MRIETRTGRRPSGITATRTSRARPPEGRRGAPRDDSGRPRRPRSAHGSSSVAKMGRGARTVRRRAVETRGGTVGRGRRGRRGGSGSRTTRVGFRRRGGRRRRRFPPMPPVDLDDDDGGFGGGGFDGDDAFDLGGSAPGSTRRDAARATLDALGSEPPTPANAPTGSVDWSAATKRMLADIAPRLRDDRAPTLTVSEMTTRRDGNNAERRCDRGRRRGCFIRCWCSRRTGSWRRRRGTRTGISRFSRGPSSERWRRDEDALGEKEDGERKEDARRRRRGARRSKRRAGTAPRVARR